MRLGKGAWMREEHLEAIAQEREEERRLWVSREEVQRLAGCTGGPVDLAIARGRIAVWPGARRRSMPSLERESAERWAREWVERRRGAELRRQERAVKEPSGPPEDGNVWLDTATAAKIVGVTENWLSAMAASSRAPVTRRGWRLWWRRDLVEAFAAARVREGR